MKRTSWMWLAAATLVHLTLLAGWRWQMPFVPYFFDATVLSGGRGLDFYSIYQAGYNAYHAADVYEGDPAKVEIVVPYFTPYRYLPIVAYTAGVMLSLLAPLSAYKIWVVVVELTLLLCVFLTYRCVRDPDLFAHLAVMWLCYTPFYLELFMGQFSFVQGALVFGMMVLTAARAQAAGKPGAAQRRLPRVMNATVNPWFDVLWIASVLWKINTLVFTPVFLRLRRFRALAAAALIMAVTTVPYFLVFPAHLRDFLANNFGNSVTGHELGNLGLRQFIFELLAVWGASPTLQRLAQLTTVLFLLGLSLILTLHPRLTHTPIHAYLALWLTTFFLVSPQIWEHHYVMLLPVLVMTYWQRPSWFVWLVWLPLALPTPFGFIGLQPVIAANHDLRAFPLEPAWQPLLQHASKAVPTLLLFLCQAWAIARPVRRVPPPPEAASSSSR